nr:MAG TPA: hypothetical protein [Caudoviricetes sp.]
MLGRGFDSLQLHAYKSYKENKTRIFDRVDRAPSF